MKNTRRKILKNIVAGGGVIVAANALPDKWAKPILKTVILPAHAQTSPEEIPPPPPTATFTISCNGSENLTFTADSRPEQLPAGTEIALTGQVSSPDGGQVDGITVQIVFDLSPSGNSITIDATTESIAGVSGLFQAEVFITPITAGDNVANAQVSFSDTAAHGSSNDTCSTDISTDS